jgi:hypothetical protein
MASIEGAIRAMLINGSTLATGAYGVPDSRVTHGYRLQDSALPAVTYSVDSSADGDISGAIRLSVVTFNCIAETSASALNVREKLISALDPGLYDTSINIDCMIVTDQTLQPETVGIGDEQEPSVATVTANVYWRP